MFCIWPGKGQHVGIFIIQSSTKKDKKIVVRILSQVAVIMMKIWWSYDSVIHSEQSGLQQ